MTKHGTIDDIVILRDVMVPMRDGVRLATDLVLPALDGKALPGPFPTLLHRTPYDKNAARLSEVSVINRTPRSNLEIAVGLAREGYAVMNQDCRGRYASEGVFQKYLGEGEDGFDTLAWARAQSWCNGRFGTFGLSYSAHVQTALAVLKPQGLDAMFLDSGGFWNAYQGGVRHRGAFEMKQVTWAFKHARLSDAAQDPAVAAALDAEDIAQWILDMDWHRSRSPLRHVPEYEAYLFDQWERGAFDDFWRKSELFSVPHYEAIARCPVFLISGWFDPYAETMVEHFKAIRALGGTAEIVMGPWLHGRRSVTYAGEADFGPRSVLDGAIAPDYDSLRRDWFARWLKRGTPTSPPRAARWFCIGGGSGRRDVAGRRDLGGEWREGDVWPPADVRPVAFYFGAEGRLSATQLGSGLAKLVSDPSRPVPTCGGAITSGEPVMVGGIFDQVVGPDTFAASPPFGPLCQRPDVLSFCTDPLSEELEIAGPVIVELELAADVADMDVAVKLVDVAPPDVFYPHGFAANLTDSVLRLRYRDSWEEAKPLVPGQPVRIKVVTPPIANRFRPGHRIRLDISGSNFPKFDINPQTGGDAEKDGRRFVGTAELTLEKARLVLPVRGG